MFRRSKKPVRPRVITMERDNDEDEDMDYTESTMNNGSPNITKVKSSFDDVTTKKATLLSFEEDLEGDESEVFKVKKSSVSRRLIKERKKKEGKGRRLEIATSDLPPSPRPSQEGEEEEILKVKNFVRILSGREAEAVDMESGSDEEETTQVRFKPRVSADGVSEVLRRTLEEEKIPDANLIHEIRKKRQMAREVGGGGSAPFIPIDDSLRYKETKSRLIREDDNDQSEDDDEQRIDFTIDSSKIDKERRREAFDAAQDQDRDRESESDSDQELEEWEKQQLSKGVSQAQLQLAAQQQDFFLHENSPTNGQHRMDLSSYLVTNKMDETRVPSNRRLHSSNVEDIMAGKTLRTVDSILRTLNERLDSMKLRMDGEEGDLQRMRSEMELLLTEFSETVEGKGALSKKLTLYQGIHSYVHDLIDCLQVKVPVIVEHENRLLGLLQAHAEYLMKRRRQDRDDEYEEISIGLRGPTPHPQESIRGEEKEREEKDKRAAERKGRRTRRKKEREDSNEKNHKEGLSTDDEELELDIQRFRTQKDGILEGAIQVFEDVEEEFFEVEQLLGKFLLWKSEDFEAYRESFVPLCIPKVLSPIVRLHLLHWDPLQDDSDIFRTNWMRSLIRFGFVPSETRESLSSDPDLNLVPSVNEKIIIPWIERLVNAEYDPVSTKQTKKLVHLLRKLLSDYTVMNSSRQIHSLLKAILKKLESGTDRDVFIPMFDRGVLAKNSEALLLASRQFYGSLKLLDNICSWTGLIDEKPLQTLALDKLLARYIVSSIRTTLDLQDTIDRARDVVSVLPRVWLSGEEIPNGIKHLVRTLILIVQERTDFALPNNKIQIPRIAAILKTLGAAEEANMITLKYS